MEEAEGVGGRRRAIPEECETQADSSLSLPPNSFPSHPNI